MGCGTRGGWDAREARGAEPGRVLFGPDARYPRHGEAARRGSFPASSPDFDASQPVSAVALVKSSRPPPEPPPGRPAGVWSAQGVGTERCGCVHVGTASPISARPIRARASSNRGPSVPSRSRHRGARRGRGRCNPQCGGECGATREWGCVAAPVRGGRQSEVAKGSQNGMGVEKGEGCSRDSCEVHRTVSSHARPYERTPRAKRDGHENRVDEPAQLEPDFR